ncbi:lysophospholipid acyltransferase family protein [Thiohalospira halophila]|uniref:lysophospholipid acyltransferase family protein n=1 Tax=Thiohalospira halophila TaxID=381300 RepID=UPI001F084874|nr:lysophospholipid acyltransferase family protein [Thiohalospira halophila]
MVLRSTLFALGMWLTTIPFGLLAVILLVIRPRFERRFALISLWSRLMVHWLRWTCGVRWEVEGRENIPDTPCLVFANHQSTWETIFLQSLFRPQTWVLKRELLAIPFFGWGLKALEPIAIERGSGRKAIASIIRQGRDRLAAGRWVVVFPEGTRLKPGEQRKWGIGGAALAASSGYPVVPVAHDAGQCWPKGSFLKRSGTIRVRIGPPLASRDREAEAINEEARIWVEDHRPDLVDREDEPGSDPA